MGELLDVFHTEKTVRRSKLHSEYIREEFFGVFFSEKTPLRSSMQRRLSRGHLYGEDHQKSSILRWSPREFTTQKAFRRYYEHRISSKSLLCRKKFSRILFGKYFLEVIYAEKRSSIQKTFKKSSVWGRPSVMGISSVEGLLKVL